VHREDLGPRRPSLAGDPPVHLEREHDSELRRAAEASADDALSGDPRNSFASGREEASSTARGAAGAGTLQEERGRDAGGGSGSLGDLDPDGGSSGSSATGASSSVSVREDVGSPTTGDLDGDLESRTTVTGSTASSPTASLGSFADADANTFASDVDADDKDGGKSDDASSASPSPASSSAPPIPFPGPALAPQPSPNTTNGTATGIPANFLSPLGGGAGGAVATPSLEPEVEVVPEEDGLARALGGGLAPAEGEEAEDEDEAKAKDKDEAKVETETEAKVETKVEGKAKVKDDAKDEAKAKDKAETETETETKAETKVEHEQRQTSTLNATTETEPASQIAAHQSSSSHASGDAAAARGGSSDPIHNASPDAGDMSHQESAASDSTATADPSPSTSPQPPQPPAPAAPDTGIAALAAALAHGNVTAARAAATPETPETDNDLLSSMAAAIPAGELPRQRSLSSEEAVTLAGLPRRYRARFNDTAIRIAYAAFHVPGLRATTHERLVPRVSRLACTRVARRGPSRRLTRCHVACEVPCVWQDVSDTAASQAFYRTADAIVFPADRVAHAPGPHGNASAANGTAPPDASHDTVHGIARMSHMPPFAHKRTRATQLRVLYDRSPPHTHPFERRPREMRQWDIISGC
jgi:hypothetical protein